MDSFTFSYVDAALERWGEWCERLMDGLLEPTRVNTIARLNEGGGSQPGHRILCVDNVPRRVWLTNYYVLRLVESQREAVTAHYAFHLKLSGAQWTMEEKAERLGISHGAFRERLRVARRTLCVPLMTCR